MFKINVIFTIFVLPYVLIGEKYFTINLLHEKVNFAFYVLIFAFPEPNVTVG